MDVPETRYARSGDLHIGYFTYGDGPVDLIVIPNWVTNVEEQMQFPVLNRFIERVARFTRMIFFDQPGTGVSDPITLASLPGLEQWIDTTTAVLDEVGSERAVLYAGDAATLTATLFAATYPERTSKLIIAGGFARLKEALDYPDGLAQDVLESGLEIWTSLWGSGKWQQLISPGLIRSEEDLRSWGRFERLAASPNTLRAMIRLIYDSDVRHILPTIRVPTLVLHRTDDRSVPVGLGRYLAEHIPGARFVEFPGEDHYLWAGDVDTVVAEIREFVTGVRDEPVQTDRVLATVLFTDIVDSTGQAAVMGDQRWRGVLDDHDRTVRDHLDRFRGREIKTTGDGFLATFDGPARAVRCAQAILAAIRALGLEVRAGVHTGEVEIRGEDVGGITVHTGQRVASLAEPGEVLVSRTVVDLVAGSGLAFEDRGEHPLKGLPGEWRLFAVKT